MLHATVTFVNPVTTVQQMAHAMQMCSEFQSLMNLSIAPMGNNSVIYINCK